MNNLYLEVQQSLSLHIKIFLFGIY